MKKVIIIGAGGHAKVIADIILKSGDEVVGFLDDNTALPDKIIGFSYLGAIDTIERYKDDYWFIIGIGSNQVRKNFAEKYDVRWYTAIHPCSIIAVDTEIGEGTVIMANAVINTSAKIGSHCIINTGAVIEHDNQLDSYVHVSPNATLCGTVSVGECTHIGAGVVIKNNTSVCSNVTIGVGGVVVKSITDFGVYVGVPVKILNQ